jgi:hypothetical protein
MPCRRAKASAFPVDGEATATTSISSGIAFTEAAMHSAWKREPTIPIPTFDTNVLGSQGTTGATMTAVPVARSHAKYWLKSACQPARALALELPPNEERRSGGNQKDVGSLSVDHRAGRSATRCTSCRWPPERPSSRRCPVGPECLVRNQC